MLYTEHLQFNIALFEKMGKSYIFTDAMKRIFLNQLSRRRTRIEIGYPIFKAQTRFQYHRYFLSQAMMNTRKEFMKGATFEILTLLYNPS